MLKKRSATYMSTLVVPISCLCRYVCTLVYVAVVCATPAVESPGSCCEGAGSIPAVRVAALPKRRLQVPGCSECAPHAAGLQDP